jgi:hypothetical protein
MDKHITILGCLFVALGLSGLIAIPFVLGSMVGGGLVTGEGVMMVFLPLLGAAITLLILVFSIPTLISGVALLRNKAWARTFGLFAAALNLANFPLGTPIGAYGLWVLSRVPVRAPTGRASAASLSGA